MFATATKSWIVVVPTSDLTVAHTLRCLHYSNRRITLLPKPAIVKYCIRVPILFHIMLSPENEARYVDMHGWMFDDSVIERLLRKSRIRFAKNSDIDD